MLPAEFKDSAWCSLLGVSIITPPHDTTFRKAPGRVIDYVLVSNSIVHVVGNVGVVKDTPWRHHGIVFTINARPRALHTTTLVTPRALPITPAMATYDAMEEQDKQVQTY